MITEQELVLTTSDLTTGYRRNGHGGRPVTRDINVELRAGEVIGLLGPNGSGKSTLIRTLAGLQKPMSGKIELFGDDLAALNPKDIAKRLSTVLTDRVLIGNLNAYTLVAFGRSPYTGLLGKLRPEDEEIVRWALEATDMVDFAGRDIQKLSDGERQKIMIARALAQDTSVILLDEPTAHLDLPNRVDIIRLLRRLSHETGKGILLSTHELDLALKASDRIWLLDNEQELVAGVPEDLVLDGTFERVFQKDSFDFDRSTGSFNIHQKKIEPISLEGSQVHCFWTARALKREGYEVVEETGDYDHIKVNEQNGITTWIVNDDSKFNSVSALVNHLRDIKDNLTHRGN